MNPSIIARGSTRGRIITFSILASFLVSAIGCAQDEPELAASESAAIPDSPLGDQLTWILGVFESGGQGVTEAEVSEHLTETFLEEVPPGRFLGIVVQVASELNPFKLESFEVGPTETHAVAILRNEQDAGNLGADADTWTYAGFKGGSEPGVLNVTAILRRKDGRWFFVSVGLNDPNSNVDGRSVQGALTTALDLLAP